MLVKSTSNNGMHKVGNDCSAKTDKEDLEYQKRQQRFLAKR